MPNQNLTHEDIHTGLSQAKSGAPWSDMLNFRSNANRTSVVPRRFKLLEFDAGFHTVLNGLNGVNYAVGSKASFLFRGHDLTSFDKLWRVKLSRETTTDDQSENIKIRGSYLGDRPTEYLLTIVAGKLVLDTNWPTPIVEEVVEPEICELVMPVENQVYLTITYPKNATKWSATSVSYKRGNIVKRGNTSYEYGITSSVAQSVSTLIAAPSGCTTSGTMTLVVTSAGMSGSPRNVSVALTTSAHTTEALIATAARSALTSSTVGSYFTISGVGSEIILTRRSSASYPVGVLSHPLYRDNDPTLNISIPTTLGIIGQAKSISVTKAVALSNPAYYEYLYFWCTESNVPASTDFDEGQLKPVKVSFQAIYQKWQQITLWNLDGVTGGLATGTKGERAVVKGHQYRCIRDCDLISTKEFYPLTKKRWIQLWTSDFVAPAAVPFWVHNNEYALNQLVVYQNAIYKAKVAHIAADDKIPTTLGSTWWNPELFAQHVAASSAKVTVRNGLEPVLVTKANAYGQVALRLSKGVYQVTAEMPGWDKKVTEITVTDVAQFITIRVP